MDKSEQQFDQLLGHLIEWVNKALAAQQPIVPLGFLLRENGMVEVVTGLVGTKLDLQTVVRSIRAAMVSRVAQGQAAATCIAFPQDEHRVIAMLENSENYASTVSIPVLPAPARVLDTAAMLVDDGAIHVFPVVEES